MEGVGVVARGGVVVLRVLLSGRFDPTHRGMKSVGDSRLVAELDGPENEALDLVPLITNTVLEECHLIVGIVVIADPGTVPINSRGEKQRMHLRDGFLADQLDPIYVAYNM